MYGEQVRAARALLRWTRRELADRAAEFAPISPETIKKWEETDGPISALTHKADAVTRVFVEAGVELLNSDRPGARLATKKAT
ncbi:hypothetical protein TSO5_03470 [Azospirillum sp. TSO5]|nr:hypothetical protein TSO5_03470 [Azospirillum sp. TSO5]